MYLGSRPELARKDSQTYELSQNMSISKRSGFLKLTDRTNFKAGIFATIVSGMVKSDVGLPLGTCNHTPHAN
jgi:hypothetical protein